MERVFESEEFSRSPVMRRLLRFLVNQTLAGNGEHLKAYSVAVDGLGRDPDFDSQTDSYPRVQVGRLRRMLDAFYARAGYAHGYRLFIPNGAYRVHLLDVPASPERREQPTEKPETQELEQPANDTVGPTNPTTLSVRKRGYWAGWMPGIALALGLAAAMTVVLAYFIYSTELLSPSRNQPGIAVAYTRAPGMYLLPTEEGVHSPAGLAPSIDQLLGDAIHRSWVVDVRSSEKTASGGRASFIAYRLQSVLAGPTGEDLYLTLWNNRTGERIWTDRIALSGRQAAMEEAIRLPVANLIGSFGVIAARERQLYGRNVVPGYACLLKNAEFRLSLAPADFNASFNCIDQTLAADQDSAAVLAASATLNYRKFLLEPEKLEFKARAQADAKAAMRLDPFSPDAQMAAARVAFIEKRCTLGKSLASRAIELNPYEPEYHAILGMYLFACGDPEQERHLVLARQMNPQLSAFFSLPVIAVMGERGQGKEALELAQGLPTADRAQLSYYAITMAVAYANGGQTARAAAIWRRLAAAPENAGRTPRQILNAQLNLPVLSQAIGSALVRAEIVVRLD